MGSGRAIDNQRDGQPRPVVVDVDTGTDDALALLLLLAADAVGEVKLLAVTCTAGNTLQQHAVRNTLRLLRAANRLDVPVYAGAEMPLLSENMEIRQEEYHGKDGFGDLDHQSFPGDDADLDGLVQQESAVVALARIASEQRGELTLVCLAPLTTVALAVRTYPALRRNLKELHVMGGNSMGHGNVTSTGEFNFACDPEAAHIVLDSVTCPVHITPWETCADSPIELDWRLGELVASGGGLAMELVTAADRSVLTAHSRTHWVTCDALTVAALLRPALVARASPRHVAVELAGSRTRGQMVPACVLLRGACPPACPGPAARLNRDAPPARLIHAFDVPAFKDLLLWAAPRWTAPPRPTTTA
ncbi:pyrimidine-specific ribonucleoside hydrolase RihA-like [Frankliniella occidentalis]|uniref:Pyrimidine-specific ribonucleoside hydrolase RihA-like n=1 Tax=Frankliniella occidentalis TaxID=133901 RepID=A0A9C6WZU6_FRAOC|nr:pyrimidine-specific ribonucleoside hydrolase RihA-like [Frankliniella occidentalis]